MLFDESIPENLNIALNQDQKLTMDDIRGLLNTVNLSDLDLEKSLGLKGGNVSGGQRQRLAIARALARNGRKPNLLILDEATAALDGKNEEEVQNILNKILEEKNCTVVVVAHRLSTIKNADVINIIADGAVVERGTHEELVNIKDGLYSGMINV